MRLSSVSPLLFRPPRHFATSHCHRPVCSILHPTDILVVERFLRRHQMYQKGQRVETADGNYSESVRGVGEKTEEILRRESSMYI